MATQAMCRGKIRGGHIRGRSLTERHGQEYPQAAIAMAMSSPMYLVGHITLCVSMFSMTYYYYYNLP